MTSAQPPRILVVGAGAIGGVVAAGLVRGGRPAAVLTTNSAIAEALRTRGFEVSGKQSFSARAPDVRTELRSGDGEFDVVFLAVQPPHVESAAASVVASLAPEGRVVCFQNGLCEERVARLVGRDRVVGAVVAWGASMIDPGRYERTSTGGFTVGRIEGPLDARIEEIAAMLEAIGPVALTENLLGARWSKLAINCAISTLGTIAGDRVGSLMRRAFARRLALDVMTEAVRVARSLGIRLQKVAGTVDLEWLALPDLRVRRAGFGLAARHAVLISAGMKYRRLRSSMLAAIERGRPPAVDFLNGEIVERAAEQGLPAIVNRTACEFVWQIARGERKASLESLRELYDVTR